jgi:hypothetical protein
MNEQNVIEQFGKGAGAGTAGAGTIDEFRKHERQYNTLINRIGGGFLRERSFQIGSYIVLSIGILLTGVYISKNQPYSSLLAAVTMAIQWYLFHINEKLRARIKNTETEKNALAFFTQKRDIAVLAAYLQRLSLLQGVLIYTTMWSCLSPERRFGDAALGAFTFIGLMIVAVTIQYQINVRPLITYLKNLVSELEAQRID